MENHSVPGGVDFTSDEGVVPTDPKSPGAANRSSRGSSSSNFAIHRDDYDVLESIFSDSRVLESILSDSRTGWLRVQGRDDIGIREIDNERRVYKLGLSGSRVKYLPCTIGKLQQLRVLDLSGTNLLWLPEEIGDLTQLFTLDLSGSGIKSLPPTIGKLQHLDTLFLRRTKNLFEIPKEIGDLTGLKSLHFNGSSIKCLPCTIGKLQNLSYLNLSDTKNLLRLPEEIGKLQNLKALDLNESNIKILPPSIWKLKNLECLDLRTSSENNLIVPEEIVDLENLTDLYADTNVSATVVDKLCFSKACKRALERTAFGINMHNKNKYNYSNKTTIIPILWPLLLNCATAAFSLQDELYLYDGFLSDGGLLFYFLESYQISEQDAIHQLLSSGWESFLQLIINCQECNSQAC